MQRERHARLLEWASCQQADLTGECHSTFRNVRTKLASASLVIVMQNSLPKRCGPSSAQLSSLENSWLRQGERSADCAMLTQTRGRSAPLCATASTSRCSRRLVLDGAHASCSSSMGSCSPRCYPASCPRPPPQYSGYYPRLLVHHIMSKAKQLSVCCSHCSFLY